MNGTKLESKISDQIEKMIAVLVEDWKNAGNIIRDALRNDKESHWLLTRLALTYYEEFQYEKALEYEVQALKLAPQCPLALWGYAGALTMLGKEKEAIVICQRLVKRGVQSLAYDECGEGLARARGLLVDALYRIALCYRALGNNKEAIKYFGKHLNQHGRGCHSIYLVIAVPLRAFNFL